MSFNLAVILSETARSSPDRPVAVFAQDQLTYRELDAASDRFAASLAATGVKPGDPIALQLPNIPQFLVLGSDRDRGSAPGRRRARPRDLLRAARHH